MITKKEPERHLLAWLIFISYEISFLKISQAKLADPIDYAGHYLLNIALFYCHYLVLTRLPSVRRLRRYLFITCIVIIEIAGYTALKFYMEHLMERAGLRRFQNSPIPVLITQSVYRAIYFMAFSWALFNFRKNIRQREEIIRLENRSLRSKAEHELLEKQLLSKENAYLQAQINQHLLFNTLSFIHNKIHRLSQKASSAIALLCDILRYAFDSAGHDGKVSLDDELKQIGTYIQLNQLRFENSLYFDFSVEGDTSGLRILPLILITLTENIFKYADLVSEEFPARMNVHVSGRTVYVKILNKLRTGKLYPAGPGIGLNNVRLRLDSYYRDNYTLNIDKNNNSYSLNLKINL